MKITVGLMSMVFCLLSGSVLHLWESEEWTSTCCAWWSSPPNRDCGTKTEHWPNHWQRRTECEYLQKYMCFTTCCQVCIHVIYTNSDRWKAKFNFTYPQLPLPSGIHYCLCPNSYSTKFIFHWLQHTGDISDECLNQNKKWCNQHISKI